jgi:hypothetical protein
VAYAWRTRWPGILGQHADHCRARQGAECSCGPLGYRANVEDPESGEPVLSPTFETLAEARAWRHEQRAAFDAWRDVADARPTVDSVVEDLLAAAARGTARDLHGRRFDGDGLRALRWALTGHVHEEIGSMAIEEVRTRHVQALVDRLDAAALSQRRIDSIVLALRTVFAYARERDLVHASPADAVALPDDAPAADAGAFATSAAVPVEVAAALPAAPPSTAPAARMAPDQAIWTALKAATLMFVLVALVLVAESV